MSSYYDLLGVPPTASTDELAAAFREKALSAHPDVPGGDAATFRALSDAYAVLRDPAQRALYDSTLRGGPGPLDDGVDAFDRWWRRSGFASPSPDPAARRAAAAADAAAAAEAWAAELADAAAARARFERSVRAARAARAERHAGVLRKVWVARPGVAWFDGVAVAGLVAGLCAVAWVWPSRRPSEDRRGEDGGGGAGRARR
jgi:curved DNA-binding protein CbpA